MLSMWEQEPSRDVHDRLVQMSYAGLEPYQSHSSYSRSEGTRSFRSTSSMAPALFYPSNASIGTPSLYSSTLINGASTVESSVSTSLANHLAGFPTLDEVDGVLVQPQSEVRTPEYGCVFWFLNCPYLSWDKEEWAMHCLSHFRGKGPPRSVQCPLCDWETTLDDGSEAWELRMHHLADEHFAFGQNLSASRPDFHLFQHLWQQRLIDDHDLKELKGGNHNLTRAPSNFVTTHGRGPRRERNARNVGPQRLQHIPQWPLRGV